MNREYTITGFDELTGQIHISVVSGNDSIKFVVDVPLNENNLYISGDELDSYIKGFIPTDFISRKEVISGGIANSEDIKALVSTDIPQQNTTTTDTANADMWAKVRFERDVAEALVKFGVLAENPTVIPVEQL